MRLAVTLLGLDLLSVELTTGERDDGEPGDALAVGGETRPALGFCLPSMEYEEP